MWRAALKSLLGRKLRLLSSTFAIVLGVSFVVGTLVFSATLERSFTSLFASTVGDVVVRPEGTDGSNPSTARSLDASLEERLRDVEGAARVDGNVTAFGVFVVDEDGKVVGGNGPPGIGANWSDAPAGHDIEGLEIIAGREPATRDEVVLDASTASKAGYTIGERVHIVTSGTQEVLQPELVGVADFVDGGSLNGATLAAFDTRTAQRLFLDGKDAYSDLWVTAEDGVSQEELRDAVAPRLPDGVEAVTGDQAADEVASELLEAISFITRFLLIFAGISLVVGAFLIVNTFSILVAQRSRELALLRALGASRRQVSRMVMVEAFAVGVVGSTLGLGLGMLLAVAIRTLFGRFGLDLSGSQLSLTPTAVGAAYAVGIVVTMLAAWLPARRTNRIAPVQAMRDDVALPESSLRRRFLAGGVLVVVGGALMAGGLTETLPRPGWMVGAGILAVLLGVASAAPVIAHPFLALASAAWSRLFGPMGRLAGHNSLRNPRRTAATASALMIGLSLACAMAIVGDSAKASVDKTIEESFVGDYVVSGTFGQPFSTRVAERLERVDGVDQVWRQMFAIGQEDGDGQGVVGAEARDLIEGFGLELREGSATELSDGTILVAEEYAAERGLEVGDTHELTLADGPRELVVVGVFEENSFIVFPVVTTRQTLVESGFGDVDNYLVLETSERPRLQQELEEVVADLPTVSVKDQEAFAAEQREPIDQMVLMIFALLALALLIAVLGIVNTLGLSIIERTREVGLLRAIGVSRPQLRWMVTLESVVIALLGAALGVVLGISFGVTLMTTLRDDGLEVISVPGGQIGAFLAAAVVIGVLAAVLPARRAARLDVLRAIGSE